MKVRVALVLFSLILSTAVRAYETEALVSIRQDSSGLGVNTWELSLNKDGSVIEEQYNIYTHDPNSIDVTKKVRKVSKQRIQLLVAQAAKLIDGLPQDVGEELVVDPVTKEVKERIVVDPETRAIRVRLNGQKLFAGRSSYETSPSNAKTEQFKQAWQAIEHLLRGPDA